VVGTIRQFFKNRYRESIDLAKAMQEEMGEDETVEFLKNYTSKRMLDYGKAQAAKAKVAGLAEYTEQFRNVDIYKNMLTMEIVEDTEKAFELKVTGCV
jgi:hypothetical protein